MDRLEQVSAYISTANTFINLTLIAICSITSLSLTGFVLLLTNERSYSYDVIYLAEMLFSLYQEMGINLVPASCFLLVETVKPTA